MRNMIAGRAAVAYHGFNGDRGVRDAGALLAEDHTHPNPKGHVVIAGLLARSGIAPLHP